jgi:uncharacterized protein
MRITNISRNRILAVEAAVADTFYRSLVGLMGRKQLLDGHGLWIPHCQSVHTFWMRFPIDVLFLSSDKKVVRTVQDMVPFRISRHCTQSKSVLELPAYAIRVSQTQVGDQLEFTSE